VLVVTPEGAAEDVVVVGAHAVAHWADTQQAAHGAAASTALLPPAGTPDAAAVAAMLKLHDALDEEDLTFCCANALSRNLVRPQCGIEPRIPDADHGSILHTPLAHSLTLTHTLTAISFARAAATPAAACEHL